ncbi:Dihydrodipicolinate synthase [Coemansia sp. RSA 2559]|nr:Dihydrodipicolinate synthase [Coemansia sp. RSA 2559]
MSTAAISQRGGNSSSVARTVLICLALYGTYKVAKFLWSKDSVNSSRKPPQQLPYKNWTKREISVFNGITNPSGPILIAAGGKVFDVSAGRGFYGAGGPYNVFAGRDASRMLATQSFDEGITEEELDSPIDKVDDLSEDDQDSLASYVGLFTVKYRCVGDLVEPQPQPQPQPQTL